jgi:hypothetical protein
MNTMTWNHALAAARTLATTCKSSVAIVEANTDELHLLSGEDIEQTNPDSIMMIIDFDEISEPAFTLSGDDFESLSFLDQSDESAPDVPHMVTQAELENAGQMHFNV